TTIEPEKLAPRAGETSTVPFAPLWPGRNTLFALGASWKDVLDAVPAAPLSGYTSRLIVALAAPTFWNVAEVNQPLPGSACAPAVATMPNSITIASAERRTCFFIPEQSFLVSKTISNVVLQR